MVEIVMKRKLNILTPTFTGIYDKDNHPLFVGDTIRYLLDGPSTKEEYWNPEYEIVFDAPCFTLKHIGGGKDGDGPHTFILKHRQDSIELLNSGIYNPYV